MVIRECDVVGITIDGPEANPPLVVDRDRGLPLPVAS